MIPPAQDEIAGAAVAGLAVEELQRLGDVRALVGQLYEALNVEEHQAQQGHSSTLFLKQKRNLQSYTYVIASCQKFAMISTN